ncbi:MAG: glycosyltransferase family 2 protein [Candidatus Woesearchaeota archaeon]|nr:glycosyltransferase family 2 protein [Candidatus Woesearchaeota archaeon]
MKIAAILPCLNEENTVSSIIGRLRTVAKKNKIDLHIIAIDDFSDDDTYNCIKECADQYLRIKKRIALAKVISIGIDMAKKLEPDAVLHIDVDGQYDPKELPKLLKLHNEGFDLVLGNRQVRTLDHMGLAKKFGNRFFSYLISTIINQRIEDSQTGYRLVSKRFLNELRIESNYTYTHEEIIKAKKLGFMISEVDIQFKRRKFGQSRLIKSTIEYLFRALYDIAIISNKPFNKVK